MSKEITDQIEQNTNEIIEFVSSLDKKSVHNLPPSGGWSIIQICDHLMSTDYGIYSLLSMEGKIASKDRESKIELINKDVVDRSKKFKVPPPLAPKGKTDTIEKFKTKFPSLRSKMVLAASEKDLSLVCDAFPHFVFGKFTFEEWLYFSIQHTNRHKLQMEEVLEELG